MKRFKSPLATLPKWRDVLRGLHWLFGDPEERRIGMMAALLLTGVSLSIGLLGVVLYAVHERETVEENLKRMLDDQVALFQQELQRAEMAGVQIVQGRPRLRQAMADIMSGSTSPEVLKDINMVLQGAMYDRNVIAIALYDPAGRLLAQRGQFVRGAASFPLRAPRQASLLWRDGELWLRLRMDMVEQGGSLGEARLDIALPAISSGLRNTDGLGEAGGKTICARVPAGGERCLPSNGMSAGVGSSSAGKIAGLPAERALQGFSGLLWGEDFQGRGVIAAFRPLGDSGLAMVVKMDRREFYGPLSQHALIILLVLIVLNAVGLLLLRWRLGPLIHELIGSRARLHTVIDNAAECIVTIDEQGCILTFNPTAEKTFGYAAAEVLGRNVSLLMPEPYQSMHAKYLAHHRQGGEARIIGRGGREVTGKHKDGTVFPLELLVSEMFVRGQRQYIGLMRDISQRRIAEQTLRESEQHLARAQEIAHLGSWDWDIVHDRLDWSDESYRLFGRVPQAEQLDIEQFFAAVHPEDRERVREALQSALRARQPYRIGYRIINAHGAERIIHAEGAVSYDEQGQPCRMAGTMLDITERQRAEDALRHSYEALQQLHRELKEAHNQLLQSEKMAAIGQLAAGVAHEINNPIGYAYSNLELLRKNIEDLFAILAAFEDLHASGSGEAWDRLAALKVLVDLEYLKEDVPALVHESCEGLARVTQIVRDLKEFSHPDDTGAWKLADLHKGFDSTINIAKTELKHKADVVKVYGELPQVWCLPSQINQVFMNLLVNAAQAIEEQGVITIRTGSTGAEVWVEVADTGQGIAPEHLSRIFEPFFTTKPVGKGTGLGLSLSYSIIKKHHGRIEVASTPGQGTRFRIWLPVEQPSQAVA